MMQCLSLNFLAAVFPLIFVLRFPGTPVQVHLSAWLFLIPVLNLPNSHRGKVKVGAWMTKKMLVLRFHVP